MSSTQHVPKFRTALDERGVSSQRTPLDGLESTLRDVVEKPAVGTSLPFKGVDLADLGVDYSPTADQLRAAKTGITSVGLGIATHGTVLVESTAAGDEPLSLYPETHVAVLRASDIVLDVSAGVDEFKDHIKNRGSAVLTTGASATGDMGELIEGVHGPREVHIIIVEDQ